MTDAALSDDALREIDLKARRRLQMLIGVRERDQLLMTMKLVEEVRALRASSAGVRGAAIEEAAKLMDATCLCKHPCEDYLVWPGPCGKQAGNAIRALAPGGGGVGDTRLKEATEFIENWFAPWGAWKTAWWEGVSGDKPWSDANALLVLRDMLKATPAGGA